MAWAFIIGCHACRSAVLRQEEAAGQLLGVLMGLDAVKVLLPVETDSVKQPTGGEFFLINHENV